MNATTTITGTPAQIKWANAIRQQRQVELEEWFAGQEATLRTLAETVQGLNIEDIIATVDSNCDKMLNANTAAGFWIDTRHMECYQILNEQK